MNGEPRDRWFDKVWVMWVGLAVAAVVLSATSIGVTRWVTADRSPVAGPTAPSAAPTPEPTPLATPSPSPSPSLTEEQQIIQQYERYLADVYTARLGPPANRREVMSATAADPLLTGIINNMEAQELDGVTVWGTPSAVLDASVQVEGSRAVLTSCLDSSQGGQADAATGRRVTVGPNRNPGSAVLTLGADRKWYMISNEYPGGTC